MKKLITILATILCITAVPVNASTPKTLVIIDTGVDMANNSIKNNIIYEVCLSGYNSCPNNKNSMEGAGAATVTSAMYSNTAWWHGTEVASVAVQTDPNVNIIEIRCASLIGTNGFINCNNNLFAQALNWAYANKDKFNIGAVVAPLASTVSSQCAVDANQQLDINNLYYAGIATILPTGNNFNYTAIASPACMTNALAISAIDNVGRLALYANYSSRVDFAALGNVNVSLPGNKIGTDSGTSFSVAVFGADWLKILNAKNISYQSEYNLIKSTGSLYTNIMVKQNVVGINISKALM